MSEIPQNWTIVRVEDVITLNPRNDCDDSTEVGFVALQLLGVNFRDHHTFEQRPWSVVKKGYTHFANGDVLLARITPSFENGKAGIARNLPNGIGAGSTEYFVCRPLSGAIISEYLLAHFKTIRFLLDGEYLMTGASGHKRVPKEYLLNSELPLAPFNEQKRIVDKLDALFLRVDTCRDHLDHVSRILKNFRQSVLSAATSGELTKDWRNGEDTSSWLHERAEDVCNKVQSGGTPKEGFIREPGIPFLKVYNIADQKIDFKHRPQFVSELIHKGSLAKSCVKPNDVLMNIVGPPLGKVAIVPNYFPEWNINQAITLFRPSEKITTGWLYYFLCSGTSVAEIFHETRGSAGQRNISLSQCRNFIFPVPPIEEQQEIVRRVVTLFDYADHVEALHHSAYDQIEQLIPALLDKAFRGELVPQDPNDETASVLLERIRTERAAKPITPKRILTTRKRTMTKISTESVKEIIHQLPMNTLSFADLRENTPGDYDSLRDILFTLLDESEPSIIQIFDEEEKIMHFVREDK
jgi:type I restriction enzyme, S subunit